MDGFLPVFKQLVCCSLTIDTYTMKNHFCFVRTLFVISLDAIHYLFTNNSPRYSCSSAVVPKSLYDARTKSLYLVSNHGVVRKWLSCRPTLRIYFTAEIVPVLSGYFRWIIATPHSLRATDTIRYPVFLPSLIGMSLNVGWQGGETRAPTNKTCGGFLGLRVLLDPCSRTSYNIS